MYNTSTGGAPVASDPPGAGYRNRVAAEAVDRGLADFDRAVLDGHRNYAAMQERQRLCAREWAVVAGYPNHAAAEAAVRRLGDGGLPLGKVSLVGRSFETRGLIQGFYSPPERDQSDAGEFAWRGGVFALMSGATGFFVLPVVGYVTVLGLLSTFVARSVNAAGVDALVSGFVTIGVPSDEAFGYQACLQKDEFLVIYYGREHEAAWAHALLDDAAQRHLRTYSPATGVAALAGSTPI